MTRVSGPASNPNTIRSFPIRPMYGIAIRNDLIRFRSDIGQTAQQMRDALAKGKPNGKQVAGDGVLQGKEYKYAAAALKDLDKALKSLKSVPDLSTFPAAAAPRSDASFPIRPMYGIAIRDDLQRFRSSINANIAELSAAVAKGKPNAKEVAGDGVLQGKELQYAKSALAQLQAAQKALKSVPGTW